jgi:hypothetical protein
MVPNYARQNAPMRQKPVGASGYWQIAKQALDDAIVPSNRFRRGLRSLDKRHPGDYRRTNNTIVPFYRIRASRRATESNDYGSVRPKGLTIEPIRDELNLTYVASQRQQL